MDKYLYALDLISYRIIKIKINPSDYLPSGMVDVYKVLDRAKIDPDKCTFIITDKDIHIEEFD